MGRGLAAPLPRTLPPLSALQALFLRVSRSNPLQTWQPYRPTNDRFQNVGLYEVRIFSASENGENGLGDEEADGPEFLG